MSENPRIELRTERATLTVEGDGREVRSTIVFRGSRINGDRWRVATAEFDDHGTGRRELVEEVSGPLEDAVDVATRHAVELHRLLVAKGQADAAFEALFTAEAQEADR